MLVGREVQSARGPRVEFREVVVVTVFQGMFVENTFGYRFKQGPSERNRSLWVTGSARECLCSASITFAGGRQQFLPVERGSEISIEEGDACVACGRRLRRPKRGGKRASSTVTRSPGRSRAFSTPLAGCTGPREFGSRTDHRAGLNELGHGRERARNITAEAPCSVSDRRHSGTREIGRKLRSHCLVT